MANGYDKRYIPMLEDDKETYGIWDTKYLCYINDWRSGDFDKVQRQANRYSKSGCPGAPAPRSYPTGTKCMPFGDYQGVAIRDIPGAYLEKMHRELKPATFPDLYWAITLVIGEREEVRPRFYD